MACFSNGAFEKRNNFFLKELSVAKRDSSLFSSGNTRHKEQ